MTLFLGEYLTEPKPSVFLIRHAARTARRNLPSWQKTTA
jgi:hypothetical protein